MNLDENVKDAVSKVIAEKIVAGLDESHRAAFLTKAITDALGDYSVKHAVEKAIAAKAAAVAQALIEQGEWTRQITEAVQRGIGEYLLLLPQAVTESLIECLHGKENGTYDRGAGLILKNLRARMNSQSQ